MIGRALVVASLLLPVASAGAQQPIAVGYPATRDVALRIWVPTGLVRVIGWDRDSIDVTGTTGKRGRYFGGSGGSSAKLGIEPVNPKDPALPGGDLSVRVPRHARVWIKMTTGHADADGIAGETDIYLVGGSIAVRNASGAVSIESIDAPVTIDRSNVGLRIRGGRGDVTLRDVGGTATITTISGGVAVAGVRAPEARIETIGGSIDAIVPSGVLSLLDLQSHDGAITVRVNRDKAPAFDLVSRGGKVSNAISGVGANGRVVARSFRGDINVRAVGGIEGRK